MKKVELDRLILWNPRHPAPIYTYWDLSASLTTLAIGAELVKPSNYDELPSYEMKRRLEHESNRIKLCTNDALTSFIFNRWNCKPALDAAVESMISTTQRLVLAVIDYHSGAFRDNMFPHLMENANLKYLKSHGVYWHTPESQTNLQNGGYVLFGVNN
jgi:hypothetical protein